jgi:hypothetical protein
MNKKTNNQLGLTFFEILIAVAIFTIWVKLTVDFLQSFQDMSFLELIIFGSGLLVSLLIVVVKSIDFSFPDYNRESESDDNC